MPAYGVHLGLSPLQRGNTHRVGGKPRFPTRSFDCEFAFHKWRRESRILSRSPRCSGGGGKCPLNYHRCTGQQDWVHPYFVYSWPPLTSSNLHSAKLRPPTEDTPPTSCCLGKPLLFFILSMNLAPLSTFYECDRAIIVCCDWLTFRTVCRGPPGCVYKGFFPFLQGCQSLSSDSALSLPEPQLCTFWFYGWLAFHCVHTAHVAYPSSVIGGLGCYKFGRLQIFLVWKWLCTCLFQTSFLSFWTNAQRQPCLVIL